MASSFDAVAMLLRGRQSLLCGVVLAIGISAMQARVRAADQADELIRRGVELRKNGQDAQALEAFRAAYQAQPTPRAQAQMGFAEQALGKWVDAERDVKAALENPKDPWIAKNTKTLRAALETVQQHLGNLQVLGSPRGARVKVDERDVGTVPFETPVRVKAGEIVKQVAAIVGGSGGGKPDYAQAGGKDAAKLPEALKKAEAIGREKLA